MPDSSAPSPAAYRFDRVTLLPVERRVAVDGRDVTIGARAFDVLLALVERRERLVTRDELLDVVWADASVEPNNLAVQIGALRKVLGPHIIATIPGRGYRLSVAVDALPPAVENREVAARRIDLPGSPSMLVGRDDDRSVLARLIDAHRLVTIAGPGGIGKSRLAQDLLHTRRGAYEHGVCWLELASIDDASSVPGALAAALGIAFGGSGSGPRFEAAIAPLEILVALDNAEHLLAGVARLAETLLASAPRMRLLVTSQAPLPLAEGVAFRLGALAVPPASVAPDQARDFGAVDLFVRRAQAVDARFELTTANTATVVLICERLDGLPLAIEFAAARAPLLGVERLAESLDQRLLVLTGGFPSAPARQQTLRATLEWSHHLLGPAEQTVFRRMAVIAGSASLEVVLAIAADGDAGQVDAEALDHWTALDALNTLVDRSLVTVVHDAQDPDRPRYRLLETPRAYAAERLAAAGEVVLVGERHAHALAGSMRVAWTDRWSGRVPFDRWSKRVEADRDNARGALAWALGREAFDVVMPIAAVLLMRFLPGDSHDERVALADALDRWWSARPVDAAQLPVRTQMIRHWSDRDVQHGLREAERVRLLAEACEDRFMTYFVEASRLRMQVQTRDMAAAAATLVRLDALEDHAWPAIRLWIGAEARGFYRYVDGSPVALMDAVRREHQMARLAGATSFVGTSHLVNAQLDAGDFAAAAAHGWVLLDEMAGSRNLFGLTVVRVNLAAALIELGDLARARPMVRAAWQTAPLFAVHAECADYLALIAALDGRWPAAAALIGYANAIYARRGIQRWPVERKVHERAMELTRAAIDPVELARRLDEGTQLADVEIEAIAFGCD